MNVQTQSIPHRPDLEWKVSSLAHALGTLITTPGVAMFCMTYNYPNSLRVWTDVYAHSPDVYRVQQLGDWCMDNLTTEEIRYGLPGLVELLPPAEDSIGIQVQTIHQKHVDWLCTALKTQDARLLKPLKQNLDSIWREL